MGCFSFNSVERFVDNVLVSGAFVVERLWFVMYIRLIICWLINSAKKDIVLATKQTTVF